MFSDFLPESRRKGPQLCTIDPSWLRTRRLLLGKHSSTVCHPRLQRLSTRLPEVLPVWHSNCSQHMCLITSCMCSRLLNVSPNQRNTVLHLRVGELLAELQVHTMRAHRPLQGRTDQLHEL